MKRGMRKGFFVGGRSFDWLLRGKAPRRVVMLGTPKKYSRDEQTEPRIETSVEASPMETSMSISHLSNRAGYSVDISPTHTSHNMTDDSCATRVERVDRTWRRERTGEHYD